MTIRLILAIIGSLVIAGIIVDALWRKRRERRLQNSLRAQYLTTPKAPTSNSTVSSVIKTEVNAPVIEQPTIMDDAPIDDLIILTVMAPSGKFFGGFDLLQSLLKAGLKHGEMQIFHRHEYLDDKSAVYFSVASVTKPGYFDIQNMNKCHTRGLTIFMSVPDVADAVNIFEIMLSTARQLAERLGGTLCDRQRQPITDATLAAYRARVRISGSIQQQMQDIDR